MQFLAVQMAEPSQIPRVAVIIPAYNEEGAIGLTIASIREVLPGVTIVVCDNHSNDRTAEEASGAGATLLYEPLRGKGNAVRRLLRDVDASIYIMVDGDNTYDLFSLPHALQEFRARRYDLMTGNRMSASGSFMRPGHGLANRMFSLLLKSLFNVRTADVFSGLRIISRRLVQSFPMVSAEFETETELTVFAARMCLPVKDFPTSVTQRMGTVSKLNTVGDGFRILSFILRLLHREYPLRVYMPLSLLLASISASAFVSVYLEYLDTGLVARLPTLFVACFGLVAALLAFFAGMILKEVSNLKYEARYHAYVDCGLRDD